jgi:hypothetical protein
MHPKFTAHDCNLVCGWCVVTCACALQPLAFIRQFQNKNGLGEWSNCSAAMPMVDLQGVARPDVYRGLLLSLRSRLLGKLQGSALLALLPTLLSTRTPTARQPSPPALPPTARPSSTTSACAHLNELLPPGRSSVLWPA